MTWRTFAVAMMAGSLLTACTANTTAESTVPDWTIVKSGLHCGTDQSVAQWLTSDEALRSKLQNRQTLPESAPKSVQKYPNHWVIYLSRSQKPTPGYGIQINGVHRLDAETLELDIAWPTPQPGKLLAQIITRPCAIIALEKDSYSAIRFRDENGEEVKLNIPD